jgi:hypothetical protein
MDDLPAREHLPRSSSGAEPRGDVQGAAAVTALHGHRFTRIEPDTHGERERGIGDRFLDEPLLESNGRADRRAGRAEHAQRLVTPELEHLTLVLSDDLSSDLGEARREATRLLVPARLRERRPSTNVCDQERMDVGTRRDVRPDV